MRCVNGLVFVWHDPEDAAPDYEIPVLPELDRDDYTDWQHKRLLIRTHPCEIVENVADKAHFMPVHGTDVEVFENTFEGHLAIQKNSGTAYPLGGGKDDFDLEATYHGPGYQLTRMRGVMDSLLFNAHTPIDGGTLHLRFGVSLRVLPGAQARMAEFSAAYVRNLQLGFEQDIAIWENKRYRTRPALCDGDGPLGRLRRWYRQFYQPREAAR